MGTDTYYADKIVGVKSYDHESVIAIIDGVTYHLPRDPDEQNLSGGYIGYGAPYTTSNTMDFSEYTYRVEDDDNEGKWRLYAATTGSHTIEVYAADHVKFHDASVTTAQASDVVKDKIFLAADGTPTAGTFESGGAVGTYVTGTFTADTTSGVHSVTIPYTGSGYPVVAHVFIDGGMYNSANDFYNLIQRYAIGDWSMHKAVQSIAPTYGTSGTDNQGTTCSVYKNSATAANSYSRGGGQSTNVFSSSDPTAGSSTCIRFSANKTMKYYTAASSYGLKAGAKYRYHIIYSS